MRRREFLAGLAAAVLAGPAFGASGQAPATRGWQWRGGTRGAAGVGDAIRAPYEINAAGASWSGGAPGLRLRASADGSNWSAWLPVTAHEAHGRTDASGRTHGDLQMLPPGTRLVQVASDSPVSDLRLDLIDSLAGPTAEAATTRAALGPTVPIISRAAWGCDETLGYDKVTGADLWPPEPHIPEKVVVHHTAGTNRDANTAATVRAIHYYHAKDPANLWGDIGYHYLVDWKGNVFEGRKGGPRVVAGHAFGHNVGTIGIACIGTFTSEAPTTEMRRSLARLIAQVAPAIDPTDAGWYVDGEMANLMGHRDALQYRASGTECPGNMLQALLPSVRGEVVENIGFTPSASAAILSVRYEPDMVTGPNTLLKVSVTVRNTGTAVLSTQAPSPAYTYSEGNPGTRPTDRSGAWRVGMNVGGAGGWDYPFRWGLPEALEPGKTVTVEGRVQLDAAGARAVSVGLVREGRFWATRDHSATTLQAFNPAALTKRTLIPAAPRRTTN